MIHNFAAHLLRCLGKQYPFRLLHDPALQNLRGVAGKDLHRFLGDDFSAVGNLVDIMHRGPGDLDTILERRLVHPQSVEALPTEGGNEGGVNIQNPARVLFRKAAAEDVQEARQNNDLNVKFPELSFQGVFKSGLGAKGLFQNGAAGN